jgi:hypothetical protein
MNAPPPRGGGLDEGPVGVGESVMSAAAGEDDDAKHDPPQPQQEQHGGGGGGGGGGDDEAKEGPGITQPLLFLDGFDAPDDGALVVPVVAAVAEKVVAYTEDEVAEQEKLYYSLYTNEEYPLRRGLAVSEHCRERLAAKSPTLAYAEISLEILRDVYTTMYAHGLTKEFGGKLYVLGAGMGKTTLAQLLLHDYDAVHGVEILHDLYVICEEVRKKFNEIKSDHCSERKVECMFMYTCGDALSMDWAIANVVYVHATMFDPAMMKTLVRTASKLKTGAFVVSVSKECVPPPPFRLALSLRLF